MKATASFPHISQVSSHHPGRIGVDLLRLGIWISLCFFILISDNTYSQETKGVGTLQASLEFTGKTHGLIIGISKYANYPSLNYADKDAEAFYNLLISDAIGADSNNIVLLLNEQATQNRLDEALMNLVTFVKEGDRVFIYFSGHGGVEGLTTSRRGFLLTNETSQNNLRLTSYRIDDLNAMVGEMATANKAEVYLFVDACHAGKVEEEQFKGLSPVNDYIGRISYGTIFLSSSPDELSLEGMQWGGGRGLFSYHLVNGMAGKADVDGNGEVDLSEIEFYVKSKVKKEAAPNPQNPLISGQDRVISQCDPELLAMIDGGSSNMLAQVAMRDISGKGYEDKYLTELTGDQRILYERFINELSWGTIREDFDFSLADQVYQKLSASGIPEELDIVLRRKLIAALQDKPQQLMDIILSGKQASSDETEICQLACNLRRSADLMGDEHYLYSITMAKYHYFKSYCYQFSEEFDESDSLKICCYREADSAVKLAPDVSLFYYKVARALDELEKYEEALLMYRKSIELDNGDSWAYIGMGLTLLELARPEEAENWIDRAIVLDPDFALAYVAKGNVLDDLGRQEEALQAYDQAIRLDPTDASTFFYKAYLLDDLKRYDEAVLALDQAIELNPSTTYYFNKALALKYSGRYEEALSVLDEYILLTDGEASGYYQKGEVYYLMEDYEKALAMYQAAKESNPEEATYYFDCGNALYRMEEYEQALAMFEQAIRIGPEDATYFFNSGLCYRNLSEYEKAVENYDRAIQLDPEDPDYYNGKAVALMYLKEYPESIALFEKCLTMDPENADGYYYNIGCMYSLQNEVEKALHYFELALASGYDNFEWIEKDSDWDNIRELKEFKDLFRTYKKKQ